MYKQPGDFISSYEPIAGIYFTDKSPSDADKKLITFLIFSTKRTPEIKFSIKQIVEVAVRALSPGINDPHTAISCIHWLGAALSMIGKKQFPSILAKNSEGGISVIRKPYSYSSIVDSCFDHLRLYAKENIFVTLEILTAIRKALIQANHIELQDALRNKATTIVHQIHLEKIPKEETDIADVHCREIMAVYEIENRN